HSIGARSHPGLDVNEPWTPRTTARLPTFTLSAFRLKTLALLPRPTSAPDTDVSSAKKTRRPRTTRLPSWNASRPASEVEALSNLPPVAARISQFGTTWACTRSRGSRTVAAATATPGRLQ